MALAFYRAMSGVRAWKNGDGWVMLPSANNDVVFVFTHFLKHFYKGGIGLRQICDWCRLLWTFREELDVAVLEGRLKRTGLVSEWKAARLRWSILGCLGRQCRCILRRRVGRRRRSGSALL